MAGGLLLHVTDWRGIFVTLALIGVLLLVSLVFALNGSGILLGRQLGSTFVGRFGPASVMQTGLLCQSSATVGVLLLTLFAPRLAPLLVCLFFAVGSVGVITPMAIALAMEDHPERGGIASGILGFIQFLVGSTVAPLVGVAGPGSAVPTAIAMPACSLAGLAALATARPRSERRGRRNVQRRSARRSARRE